MSGFSLVAQMVKNLPVMQETWVWSLGWEEPLEGRREWLPTPVFLSGESHGQKRLAGYNPLGNESLYCFHSSLENSASKIISKNLFFLSFTQTLS